MIIPLSYPLRFFYDLKSIYKSDDFYEKWKFSSWKAYDKGFNF